MGIKKLFETTTTSRNYLAETTEKDAFQDVESATNLRAINKDKQRFVPQINYSRPKNFARFGSAYLYYKSSIERVLDYYPYDGSDAEINEYFNESLDIDRYILRHLYPRSTGYALLSADGWGSLSTLDSGSGYGLPSSLEYITFYGGPGTGSANLSGSSLVNLGPNDSNSKFQYSNIYEASSSTSNLYSRAGLPLDYGKGSRESNLKSNFDNGVTVEFWLKKDEFDNSLTSKEVVFDMWNTNETGSDAGDGAAYGRITIELTGATTPTGSSSPFVLTAQSGTSGIFTASIGQNLTVASLTSWQHYAVSFYNSGSEFISKLYVNGALNDTLSSSTRLDEIPSKNMVGQLGGLLTNVSGGAYTTPGSFTATSGSGKLSGSLDEFRFWKVRRTGKEIGEHWFSQVKGGVNTDISNTTLGMYYKFNEGITGNPAVDSIVLDYGGRVCNGGWVGYDASSRNTGSAILSASAAIKEYNDPIVRSVNPKVINLKSGLLATGSAHDSTNNASILSLTPEWVIEDHGDDEVNNLNIISHIIGSYFDTLYQQIEAVPTLNQANYPSASYKPMPFAEHLPQSLGLYTPELFVDATVMEKFLNRDKERLFSGDLTETKNLIYTNLYNNLTSIYKSKGTEKAIRNVLRCFSVDERFMRLGVYADRQVYELKDNLRQTLVNRKSLNFNTTNNLGGVAYQRLSSSNVNSLGYLSGTYSSSMPEARYGCTIEADITFPRYNTEREIFERNFASASLFGGYSVVPTGSDAADSQTGEDTTWATNYGTPGGDVSNFQILAIKSQESAKNVSFILTSSNSPHPLPTLTSSQFLNVYDETEWNFSVRVKPSIYPFAEVISGAVKQDGATYNYDVIFRGTNTQLGSILETFEVTGTMSQAAGTNFLNGHKRLYAGARRTNITGALLNKSDVLFNGLRYWAKYLDNGTLDQHAYDLDNMGISASYQPLSPLDSGSQGYDILNNKALLLSWNFESVTGSNPDDGEFSQIIDISSGSSEIRNNFGWLGKQAGYQHTGYGYGFPSASTDVVRRQAINAFRFIDPEQVNASDMVQILSDDDKTFGTTDTYMAPDYYYTLEKSLYNAISEEMLDFFAGVVDFNNVIGAPVNRYRERYKDLEKLREVFFRKVTTIAEVERFIGYYKWFDDAIAQIVEQLMPASSDFKADVMNVVESHVLERNKYQTKYPTLEFKIPTLDDALSGIEAASYDYHQGSSVEPGSPRNTKLRYKFWHERAERTSPEISSSYPAVDTQREIYRKVINSAPRLTQSLNVVWTEGNTGYDLDPYAARNFGKTQQLKVDPPVGRHRVIKGGVNFAHGKNIMYVYNALYPFGPINTDGGRFIPLNVLFTPAEDLVHNVKFKMLDSNPTGKKRQRVVKVQHGRDWEGGLGYKNVKSTYGYPFNLVSGNVTTGYNAAVSTGFMTGVILTNLHNDVYGPDMEVPMQGPFTDYAVGGHQSRHVRLSTGSSETTPGGVVDPNRPEAWKLAPGVCDASNSGAIGMVSADYPYPDVGQAPGVSTGTITIAASQNITAGDYVTINDGDNAVKFEVGVNWTAGGDGPTSGVNLKNAINTESDFNILATYGGGAPVEIALANTKYGASTTTLRSGVVHPSGSIGNVTLVKDGDNITVSGMASGVDPKILNFNAPRATYYRDMIAKAPVNIKNIRLRSGSTILGNYRQNYEVVSTVGAFSNPRRFVKNPISMPDTITDRPLLSASDVVRTYLNLHRGSSSDPGIFTGSHFNYELEYAPIVNTGSDNQSIIISRFGAPGGPETMTRGYQDFRASEFSVYNTLNNRNLSVIRPSQGPSDTVSETTGIRVSDINSEDYGLYSHAARHAARFGRDSLAVADYDLTSTLYMIGASSMHAYTSNSSLQGWWRLNRDVSAVGDVADSSGNGRPGTFDEAADRPGISRETPGNKIQVSTCEFDGTSDRVNIGAGATWDAIIGNNTGGGSTQLVTLAAWIYIDDAAAGTSNRIIQFGGNPSLGIEWHETSLTFDFFTYWSTSGLVTWKTANNALTKGKWHHVVTTYDGSSTANDAVVYLDGKVLTAAASETRVGTWNGISSNDCYIGASVYDNTWFEGNMGDVAVWNSTLTSDEVKALYNATKGAFLNLNPAGNFPGASLSQRAAMFKVNRNPAGRVKTFLSHSGIEIFEESVQYDNFNVQHTIPRMDKQYAWVTSSIVLGGDFTEVDYRYYGRAQTWGAFAGLYLEPSGTDGTASYSTFFDYVMESDVSKDYDPASPSGDPSQAGGFVQGARLNTYTIDPINSGSTNLLGFDATSSGDSYIGAKPLTIEGSPNTITQSTTSDWGIIPQISSSATYLNLLLTRRRATYGWTWLATRQQQHPILLKERDNQKISVVTSSNDSIMTYRLAPLSNRGRPVIMNFDVAGTNNTTIKITHNNEQLWFNDPNLDNVADFDPEETITAYEQLLGIIRAPSSPYNLNWVAYSENLFPSLRNEFSGGIISKPTYNNKYWRDSKANRVTEGNTIANSYGIRVSQSAWPLDPPEDFLTRTVLPSGTYNGPGNDSMWGRTDGGLYPNGPYINYPADWTQGGGTGIGAWANNNVLKFNPKSGELQNGYVMANLSSSWGANNSWFWPYSQGTLSNPKSLDPGYGTSMARFLFPGALYARKHMLSSPSSLVSPTGVRIAETGSLPRTGSWEVSSSFEAGAGEAVWEAGQQAGIIVQTPEVYSLTASFTAPNTASYEVSTYTGADTLQGWWRLNTDLSSSQTLSSSAYPGNAVDSSGKGRTGTFDADNNRPLPSVDVPSPVIQLNTCFFDGTNDNINIGTAATWNAIIGNDTAGGSTEQMTFSAWMKCDSTTGYDRIFYFGNDVVVYVDDELAGNRLWFYTFWNGSVVYWRTPASSITKGKWHHIAVTYDASLATNDPKLYIDGISQTVEETGTTPTGAWLGIDTQDCYLGGDSSNFFEGTLGDMAVWNSILTDDEIKAIANALYNPNLGSPSQFQLSASAPWFDQYSDYNYEMKLLAKDYSIVPEFRISDHVEDYLKYGLFNPNKFDWCTIPETGINSSTSSFYLDYSNSEFMHDFLRVKNETLLNAKEIKLVCSAAIRFNPYKGFYPVQRTLQMVGAFSSSYMHGFIGNGQMMPSSASVAASLLLENSGGLVRPGLIPFHAPGILYNSIKSGIAVDYPIITNPDRVARAYVYQDDEGANDDLGTALSGGISAMRAGFSDDLYAITCLGTGSRVSGLLNPIDAPGTWRGSGSWFNKRLPFEAIITPEVYLDNTTFIDLEAHPSGGLLASASWNGAVKAPTLYSRMARNFFGEVGNFFLKDGVYTKLKSAPLPSDIQFDSGSVYGARLKLRRSCTGSRTYEYDALTTPSFTRLSSGSHFLFGGGLTSSFGQGGGRGIFSASVAGNNLVAGGNCQWMTGTFPLPQDPHSNPFYKETFTMYSRPSAFGPDITGRPILNQGMRGVDIFGANTLNISLIGNEWTYDDPVAKGGGYVARNYSYDSSSYYARHMGPYSGTMDCFNGFNWAYTPPYYHGEAWADFIFRPTAGTAYDLDKILAETKVRYWRADPGWEGTSGSNFAHSGTIGMNGRTPLIPSFTFSTGAFTFPPYDGTTINHNAMQLSASVDMFGIETVPLVELDVHGKPAFTRNEVQGKRWVIQPKFETPMLNFNDEGIHPITKLNGNLTLPTNFSASVPRGMWHQFGVIPEDPDKGVFLEMGDIPPQWLQYHYECINTGSVYNDGNIVAGQQLHEDMRSLSDVVGFNSNTPSARLGELADSRTIREAVVAIPYIIENVEVTDPATLDANWTSLSRKKFIEIPAERYAAASAETDGSEAGDSLAAAGESIRKLIQKMGRYILPPQFDFINNESITPMVMYMFEFEYTFDKDDLSYMWQNLAPRNSKEIKLEYKSVAHELMDTELLNESIIMDNANLRWMVFKVKQKSQVDYYDLRVQQLGQIEAPDLTEEADSAYKIEYNWPYDFLSFVEMIKIDAEVLFTSEGAEQTRQVMGEGEFSLPSNIVAPGIVAQVGTTLQQGPLTPESIGETIIEAVSNIPLQQGNLVRQKAVTRQPRAGGPGVLKKAKTGPYSKKKTGSKTSTKKSSKNKKK